VLEGRRDRRAKLTAGFYNPMFVWVNSPAKAAAKTFIRWFIRSGRLEPLYQRRPASCGRSSAPMSASERVRSNRLLNEALTKVVPFATDFAYPGYGRRRWA